MNNRHLNLDIFTKIATIIGMGLISLVILNFTIVKPIVDNNKMKKREEAREIAKQRMIVQEEFYKAKDRGDTVKAKELKDKIDNLEAREYMLYR